MFEWLTLDRTLNRAQSGGGIGGVTLALALSKYPDIRFDLYEAAGAFEEIGAGVGIFARSLYALEDLGLIDALETINTPSSLSGTRFTSGNVSSD